MSAGDSIRSAGVSRRSILGAAALLAVTAGARAADYPTRPVKWVVGYPPGGTTDILARLMGAWLTQRLGQQFIIENRPGAGNNIGTEAVVGAPPDGYTVLLVNPANGINTSLYKDLSFDFVRDIAPVAGIVRVPNVMAIYPGVPARTIPEFVAFTKANPGKVNMASSGIGTSVHLSGELFKKMTGADMTHVPYKGAGPALTELLAGQVQVIFDNLPSSIQHIRAGKLIALGVTTAVRSPALPDVPAIGEFVPGYEASAWFGMGAPKGTPPEAIAILNRAINEGLADPGLRRKLADLGGLPLTGTPADFGRVIRDETEKWKAVVEFSGATVE